jgi:hypothetical protein
MTVAATNIKTACYMISCLSTPFSLTQILLPRADDCGVFAKPQDLQKHAGTSLLFLFYTK